MATPKKPPPSYGKWIDDIVQGVGNNVNLETTDGIRRNGRLSAVRTRRIVFNNGIQEIVTDLELNGDPTDTVAVAQLSTITIN